MTMGWVEIWDLINTRWAILIRKNGKKQKENLVKNGKKWQNTRMKIGPNFQFFMMKKCGNIVTF